MSATELLLVGSTNTIKLAGLRDALTLAYKNGATVSITLKDATGVAVSGETWPKTMSYQSASSGDYVATLAAALDLVPGVIYYGHITAEQDGSTRYWKKPFLAVVGSE